MCVSVWHRDIAVFAGYNPRLLKNSKIADRGNGKAAAMLFGLGQAGEIYAEIVSNSAKQVLTDAGIPFSFSSSMPYIKNRIGMACAQWKRPVSL